MGRGRGGGQHIFSVSATIPLKLASPCLYIPNCPPSSFFNATLAQVAGGMQ